MPGPAQRAGRRTGSGQIFSWRKESIEHFVEELPHLGGIRDTVLGEGILGALVRFPIEESVAGSVHDIQHGILDRNDFDSDEAFLAAIKRWYAEDRRFRINHISWWKQELPSKEEMEFGLKTLEENNFEVDYIITHCAPQEIASAMGYRGSDMLTQYLNTIASDTKFTRWYFGHYHNELTVYGKFVLLYNRIERIV